MNRHFDRLANTGALALGVLGWGLATITSAEIVDISKPTPVNVGPSTTYGETKAEAANKRIMFEFLHMNHFDRKPKEAFEKYVSKDYCNHGHLSTRGQKDCVGYDETLQRWMRYATPVKPGQTMEVPTMAAVDGEMVTMYGEGVDIFRVHNGRITDHWDGSPPAEARLGAHDADFAKWAMAVDRKGPPPKGKYDPEPHVVVTQKMLDSVDVGAVTPYGETAKEAAAKRVMFESVHMQFMEGKARSAVERYTSKDFCNHSHMSTHGQKDCQSYEEKLSASKDTGATPKVGDVVEIPTMASVDGEMVTMYGAGVDIFQVRDGKILAHWDGSPPMPVTIKAHEQKFVDNMVKVVAGDPSAQVGPGMAPAAAPAPAK